MLKPNAKCQMLKANATNAKGRHQKEKEKLHAQSHLRFCCLAFDRHDCVLVAREHVDRVARSHIPHSGHTIASTGDENVNRGVQCNAVDSRKVAVVVTHHLFVCCRYNKLGKPSIHPTKKSMNQIRSDQQPNPTEKEEKQKLESKSKHKNEEKK